MCGEEHHLIRTNAAFHFGWRKKVDCQMFYLFAASESNIRLHCCKWLHTGKHHCRWQHSGRVCPSKVVAVSAEDKNSAPSSSTPPPASPMSTRRPTTLKTVRCSRLQFLAVLKQKGERKKTGLPPALYMRRCSEHTNTRTHIRTHTQKNTLNVKILDHF